MGPLTLRVPGRDGDEKGVAMLGAGEHRELTQAEVAPSDILSVSLMADP